MDSFITAYSLLFFEINFLIIEVEGIPRSRQKPGKGSTGLGFSVCRAASPNRRVRSDPSRLTPRMSCYHDEGPVLGCFDAVPLAVLGGHGYSRRFAEGKAESRAARRGPAKSGRSTEVGEIDHSRIDRRRALHETHLPAEPDPSEADSWLSSPHEDPRRPSRDQAAPQQGTKAADGRHALEIGS
jgi:hypothetical protein